MNEQIPVSRARLHDGTEVDIVVGRMDTDTQLPDHWRIAIYKHSSSAGPPLIESYPLPPEIHDLELDAVADELLSELDGSRS